MNFDYKTIHISNYTGLIGPKIVRDRSQTLVKGELKIFEPCKGGAWKKITTDFPLRIEFTCFSMGLTRNFHGKKGAWIFFFFFFAVWRGAPKNFRDKYFLYRAPLTSVCERSLMQYFLISLIQLILLKCIWLRKPQNIASRAAGWKALGHYTIYRRSQISLKRVNYKHNIIMLSKTTVYSQKIASFLSKD